MKRTYEIEAAPVPAMTWEDYERLIRAQWADMLARKPGPTEASVHEFFETYIDVLMHLQRLNPAGGYDALALQAAVAAVHALFDFNFYMPANAATLAAICGAGVGLRSTEEVQTRARGADVRRA